MPASPMGRRLFFAPGFLPEPAPPLTPTCGAFCTNVAHEKARMRHIAARHLPCAAPCRVAQAAGKDWHDPCIVQSENFTPLFEFFAGLTLSPDGGPANVAHEVAMLLVGFFLPVRGILCAPCRV
jgi:hypothetical protein